MQRRNFVRVFLSVLAAPRLLLSQQAAKQPLPAAAPVPWFLGLNPRTPLPTTEPADGVAASDLKFFTPAQMSTLIALSRVMMPPLGGKPGAVEAGTPEFLDFLLAGSAPEKQKMYAGGLDWLEAEAGKKYKRSFAALNEAEAGALLKPWMRTWMSDHPPTEAHADFVNVALDEIREATFNSKAWGGSQMGLYWSPIEPEVGLLQPVQPHVLAKSAARSMPTYQR